MKRNVALNGLEPEANDNCAANTVNELEVPGKIGQQKPPLPEVRINEGDAWWASLI